MIKVHSVFVAISKNYELQLYFEYIVISSRKNMEVIELRSEHFNLNEFTFRGKKVCLI